MKVVFKLTAEQADRASAIVAEVKKNDEEERESCGREKYLSYCGNLIGEWGHSFSFNSNQSLEFFPDSRTVVYEGERNPLVEDMGLHVLGRIAEGEAKTSLPHSDYKGRRQEARRRVQGLSVVSYETTDARLAWYDTYDDVIGRVVKTLDDLVTEVRFQARRGVTRFPSALVTVAREHLAGYQFPVPGTKEYARASASGSLDYLRKAEYVRSKLGLRS